MKRELFNLFAFLCAKTLLQNFSKKTTTAHNPPKPITIAGNHYYNPSSYKKINITFTLVYNMDIDGISSPPKSKRYAHLSLIII